MINNSLMFFLVALLVIYLMACVLLYVFQERLIFFPEVLPLDYSFEEFDNCEERFFEAGDGARIHALHFRANAPKGVILYFHGNKGAVDGWGYEAAPLVALGYDVLMPDYRGYGKSEGKLGEKAIHADAMRCYQVLLKEYDERDIVLYGRSLGTGVACRLGASVNPRIVILETPYTSILDMAGRFLWVFPVQRLLRYRFRNKKYIKRIACPVHIFHGTADEVVPYTQGKRLAKRRGEPDCLTTIPNGLHGNLKDFPLFRDKLEELLACVDC